MKKRLLALCLCFCAACALCGCGSDKQNTGSSDGPIKGALSEIMERIYAGIDEDELPMGLENQPITADNIAAYVGTDDFAWEEAIASESMVGSIAHSVVLIRMQPTATPEDIDMAKEKIKSNADPRKWICVEAEHVYVESKGDLIILIMSGDIADTLKSNFEQLN